MSSNSNHRVPVSEERRDDLRELKEAGESYDELLAEMIQHEKERRLAEKARAAHESDDFVPLDEL